MTWDAYTRMMNDTSHTGNSGTYVYYVKHTSTNSITNNIMSNLTNDLQQYINMI